MWQRSKKEGVVHVELKGEEIKKYLNRLRRNRATRAGRGLSMFKSPTNTFFQCRKLQEK